MSAPADLALASTGSIQRWYPSDDHVFREGEGDKEGGKEEGDEGKVGRK